MIRFECDYGEGAHARILERMMATNMEQTEGYGMDPHCERARALIKEAAQAPDADVHFLVGGTQCNATVIASALRPWQGVISANTGHINVHETGAIEASGHKVLALPSKEGKITAQQIADTIDAHWNDVTHEHIVQPGMVYISNPTEYGTLYTKEELTAISKVCRDRKVWLYLDGARLGYALGCEGCDLQLSDYAQLCDAFYIGGTKVGALFGEALMITADGMKADFRYNIKQRGGMLAKGRLLGIQFETLFEDGLYTELGRHADALAQKIAAAFKSIGCAMLMESKTNQQFPILNKEQLAKLGEKYAYSFWEKVDEEHSAVRFCTSWCTTEEAVEQLIADIKAL